VTIVVDASVAARWFLPLEKNDAAKALLRSGERIIAPDLVIVELANTAWKATTFGNAPLETGRDFVGESARYFHELVPSSRLKDRALAIALALKHPVYDCFYIALAEQRGCSLVTADERLQRKCATTPFAAFLTAL
jgi:predicted nucleic acid-binding protein